MTRRHRLSRREVLATGVALASGLLAGCSRTGGSTSSPSPPIVGTRFDGPDLVVDLRAGHDASELNLIGPDGELFASTMVEAGVTTTRLQILRIQPGPGFKHYTPGTQTLVASGLAGEQTVELDLRPSLRIVGVEQYRDGTSPADLGRLAVTVENAGTGPTWVYQISYTNSPNWTANDRLASDSGVSRLIMPYHMNDLIIHPVSMKTYVGETLPLSFIDQAESHCSGDIGFTVLVGTANGGPIEKSIQMTIGGDVIPIGQPGDYVCSEVAVRSIEGVENG